MIEWLHATQFATYIRESNDIYPFLQCVHIVGIGMFLGAVGSVNLRLAGLGSAVGLGDFAAHAMRVAWVGLALILMTGVPMFVSFINVFAISTVMRIKFAFIAIVVVNAIVLQRRLIGPGAAWTVQLPDRRALLTGVILASSAMLTLITLGKLLAYIGGKD